jgi:hypothetical protein
MDLGDRLSTRFTQAYLDKLADRGLLRRDLLDALLAADGGDTLARHVHNHAVQLARRLHDRKHPA